MAQFHVHHPILKASGFTITVAAAIAFVAFVFGANHSDWGVVASFVGAFVGLVLFLFGWMMK